LANPRADGAREAALVRAGATVVRVGDVTAGLRALAARGVWSGGCGGGGGNPAPLPAAGCGGPAGFFLPPRECGGPTGAPPGGGRGWGDGPGDPATGRPLASGRR